MTDVSLSTPKTCRSGVWALLVSGSPCFLSEAVRLILSFLRDWMNVNLDSLTLGLTIGAKVGADPAKEILKTAFENGINMFDTAETYNNGCAEFEL